ncbi:single-stranded DNA-binding protein [Patescibacteria group bacterium]|nr:single-stranded DNA-binding protein [Candidatus Falkowbacteria bacterium]MBU3906085.1 single-stranded DNA-binding protein [Patescibacteria group bacterium]MBU4015137.1 single-stranded DNA-binding protein [Patescibacteria group bacterium]MBU4025951.1 single-stranded DNA-binding protein [Patescibacteria group bacterium]MBU4073133.1 single-stranded DNA-binding protein [Patescibacteria group bacterium]
MNLNKAMIIGNLTRDPEIRTTPTGKTVASFDVATSFVWKDSQTGEQKKTTEFHHVVAWTRLAEICGQYLHKGSKVYIEGRLQTRDWLGQQDGIKRYRTEIIAENMIMLGGAGQGGQSSSQADQPPAPEEQPSVSSEPIINIDEPTGRGEDANPAEEEIKVENIPF